MDKSSLQYEICQITAQWFGGLDGLESARFKTEILPKIISLSKRRRLPEGFILSLFKDALRGDGSIKELRRYYEDNKQPSYSSRTPAWVKIAISTLAKDAPLPLD